MQMFLMNRSLGRWCQCLLARTVTGPPAATHLNLVEVVVCHFHQIKCRSMLRFATLVLWGVAIVLDPRSTIVADTRPPSSNQFDEAITQTSNRWVFEESNSSANEENRIETERHDFTQSVKTVGKGVGQFEFGYLYTYKDQDDEISQTHATPELVFRYGVTDRIEVAMRFNYVWRFFGSEEDIGNEDSAEDMRLGVKFETSEQDDWLPQTAIDVRMTVPTGGNSWTTNKVEVGTKLIYAWELAERVELSGSTGLGTNGIGNVAFQEAGHGQGDDFVIWFTSVALGFPLSEEMEAYVEYYGLWSDGFSNEVVQNYFNIGIDFLITDDYVLDFRIGKGLSRDAEDFFVGVGGGYRF